MPGLGIEETEIATAAPIQGGSYGDHRHPSGPAQGTHRHPSPWSSAKIHHPYPLQSPHRSHRRSSKAARINITATDLDQAIRISAKSQGQENLAPAPSPRASSTITPSVFRTAKSSIKLLDNHWVQIRGPGRSNTKMVGLGRANYPQVPELPTVASVKISVPVLKTLIARTIFSISNEESRYTLNGALLILKAESIAMVATDGHRLSFVEKPGENSDGISGEKRFLIPRKALAELQSLLGATEAEHIEFADDDLWLFFRIGHRTLSSRKLTGQFPNYEAVMPRDTTRFCRWLRAARTVRSHRPRSPVRRRTLRRSPHQDGAERAQDHRPVQRVRRIRRLHRNPLHQRSA